MKRVTLALLTLSLSAAAVTQSRADAIPYPNTGTIAPQVATYAMGNSGINVYFYGSTAAFNDYVEIKDAQTGFDSGQILENHTTTLGQELTVGANPGQIDAGDQLVFYIDSPEGQFASIASDSADGVNHGYITGFSGGMLNGVTIPSGLFVGLEDEANGESDFNYNDDTFVFAGVSAPSITPEPGTFLLLGTGLLSVAGLMRRRMASSRSGTGASA